MGETSGTATAARGTLYLLLLSIFGAIAAGGLLAAAVGDIWSGWTSRGIGLTIFGGLLGLATVRVAALMRSAKS